MTAQTIDFNASFTNGLNVTVAGILVVRDGGEVTRARARECAATQGIEAPVLGHRDQFAIRTLLNWYREGIDIDKALPSLSTYLGHTCVRDTYWYLSACPELMQEAARRLGQRWEVAP